MPRLISQHTQKKFSGTVLLKVSYSHFPSMPENLSAVIRSLTALECMFILDLYIEETDFLHGQS